MARNGWTKEHTELWNILAERCGEEESSRSIATEAELDTTVVTFSTNARNNWRAIIHQAEADGKLVQLIKVAIKWYPGDTRLKELLKVFEAGTNKTDNGIEDKKKRNTILVLAIILSAVLILLIGLFWVGSQCNQANPAKWIRPLMQIACPKETPGPTPITPTPTLEITVSVNTPTVAITPPYTTTPIEPVMPAYFIRDCINSSTWVAMSQGHPLENKDNLPCLDLSNYGFAAQSRTFTDDTQGLRIYFKTEEAVTNGIYFMMSDKQEINLLVEIDELSTYEEEGCGTARICDVNLMIGVGDPTEIDTTNWYLLFRKPSRFSERLVCTLSSYYDGCSNPNWLDMSFPLDTQAESYNVKINNNGLDVSITINDSVTLEPYSLLSKPRKFWIGYNFRSSGRIKAFITFLDPEY